MKAYAVLVIFKDGSQEGVIFTDKKDALDALNGVESGSTLAISFNELYEGDPLRMVEIEI